MKKIVPIATGISLTGLIVSFLVFLFMPETTGLSTSFKTIALFFSLTIGLFAYWKSGYNNLIILLSAVNFGLTVLVLFNTTMLVTLWNFAVGLHILLIGYTLFRLTLFPFKSKLFGITQAVILLTTVLFFAMIVFRVESNLFFILLLILLTATSLLFAVSQLFGIVQSKKEELPM